LKVYKIDFRCVMFMSANNFPEVAERFRHVSASELQRQIESGELAPPSFSVVKPNHNGTRNDWGHIRVDGVMPLEDFMWGETVIGEEVDSGGQEDTDDERPEDLEPDRFARETLRRFSAEALRPHVERRERVAQWCAALPTPIERWAIQTDSLQRWRFVLQLHIDGADMVGMIEAGPFSEEDQDTIKIEISAVDGMGRTIAEIDKTAPLEHPSPIVALCDHVEKRYAELLGADAAILVAFRGREVCEL